MGSDQAKGSDQAQGSDQGSDHAQGSDQAKDRDQAMGSDQAKDKDQAKGNEQTKGNERADEGQGPILPDQPMRIQHRPLRQRWIVRSDLYRRSSERNLRTIPRRFGPYTSF
jgi:hypothetical protein